MSKIIRVVSAVIITDRPVAEPASMLRGYIGGKFPEYTLLHNHQNDGYDYRYPLVQYKLLEGAPVILGIEDGGDILMKILPGIESLQLANNLYNVLETKITTRKHVIQQLDTLKNYKFATPWLGLNQENYEKYIQATDWKNRKGLLNSILLGNILSMCKGLGIKIEERINLQTHLDNANVHYKGVLHKAFMGNFRVNFELPEFFGLGKGVSQGFGVVMHAKEKIDHL